MKIAKKPKLDVQEINKIIKKGGSISSEEAQENAVNITLKLPSNLNSAIEALQKNKFGMKRTKKQWIIEAILAKIKKETGKEYQEASDISPFLQPTK